MYMYMYAYNCVYYVFKYIYIYTLFYQLVYVLSIMCVYIYMCQFGPSAMSAQVKRPIAREPWLRSGKGTRLFALGRACAFVIGSGAKANRALAPASRTSHGAP